MYSLTLTCGNKRDEQRLAYNLKCEKDVRDAIQQNKFERERERQKALALLRYKRVEK